MLSFAQEHPHGACGRELRPCHRITKSGFSDRVLNTSMLLCLCCFQLAWLCFCFRTEQRPHMAPLFVVIMLHVPFFFLSFFGVWDTWLCYLPLPFFPLGFLPGFAFPSLSSTVVLPPPQADKPPSLAKPSDSFSLTSASVLITLSVRPVAGEGTSCTAVVEVCAGAGLAFRRSSSIRRICRCAPIVFTPIGSARSPISRGYRAHKGTGGWRLWWRVVVWGVARQASM